MKDWDNNNKGFLFQVFFIIFIIRRKGAVDTADDDNNEADDKNRHGARACRIAKSPVHEDAVVHLSAVEPGLCLSCSKDKVCVILANSMILKIFFLLFNVSNRLLVNLIVHYFQINLSSALDFAHTV